MRSAQTATSFVSDAKSGKIRWQKSLRKDFGGEPHEWAYAESPLIDGDAVVVTPGGAQATIVALNKKTGAVIWKSAVPGGDPAGYASAIVVQGGGRKQYVQFLSKGIVGVDAKTGEFLWRYKEVVKGPAQAFTPVARGEYIYGGALSIGGGLVRLKPDGSGITAEQVYFERGLPNGFGGALLVGDYLYGTQARGGLVAVEFTTGKVKWQSGHFRHEFGSLRRREFIHSRRDRGFGVGRGDTRRLSRKRPLHAAESAEEKTDGTDGGESVCVSGDCERQTVHSRPRVVVGLRHQRETLATKRHKSRKSQCFSPDPFNSFSSFSTAEKSIGLTI
jgi:hypothetical protein